MVPERKSTIRGINKEKSYNEKVIAVWVSFGRSSLEAAFLKSNDVTENFPEYYIDGGTWYPRALDKTGFKRYTVIANYQKWVKE